jgi:hypothetical protein
MAREVVRRLAPGIAEDRAALFEIMNILGVPARCYKVCAAGSGRRRRS